jgi:hypothetical protein
MFRYPAVRPVRNTHRILGSVPVASSPSLRSRKVGIRHKAARQSPRYLFRSLP